jgi:REP element-mobilizing transposase RayT
MAQPPHALDPQRRICVLDAVSEVCALRKWQLLAAHVRATHVHTVVESPVKPEPVMLAFKAYASRRLTQMGFENSERKRWARHGSTLYLWTDHSVRDAMKYVVEEQGSPMALFVVKDE